VINPTFASAQYPISEHADFAAWKKHTSQWIAEAVSSNADVLVFPEYGSMELVSIFSSEIRSDIRKQVLEMQVLLDDFCEVFSEAAIRHKIIIVAPSFPVQIDKKIVNRVFVFSAKGLCGYQDKFFMTRFENEEWGIQSGEKRLTLFEASWGSFGIQICYDVEFGVGSQLLCAAGASVIIAPSCTETIRGATRVHVGARARAMENQAYVVVSQTVGNALWSPTVDINYGYAAVYATPDKGLPEEGILNQMPPQLEGWLIEEPDFSLIEEVRRDGQVFNFKDQQTLITGLKNEKIRVVKVSV